MPSIPCFAVVSAVVSLAVASHAPVAKDNPLGITFSATIPQLNATDLSGNIKISAAPDGIGANIQISLYNLPNGGNLAYGIHTGHVGIHDDCAMTGTVLNPYNGITGGECKKHQSTCQVGDLSDKHGLMTVMSGGSGTGYFAANYVDKYLSLKTDSPAYIGKRSIVIVDSAGAYVACVNLINALHTSSITAHNTIETSKSGAHSHTTDGMNSSSIASMPTGSSNGTGTNASSTARISNSPGLAASAGLAVETAIPLISAGLLGLAAFMM